MPITRDTLRLVGELRATADHITDQVTRGLVAAWVTAWDEIAAEFIAVVGELMQLGGDRWPTRAQVLRTRRTHSALDLAARTMQGLIDEARADIAAAARDAATAAMHAQNEIVASQLPYGSTRAAAARHRQVNDNAIDAIVRRTAEQVNDATWPLSDDATEAMKAELVRGVVLGKNPRAAASTMVKRVEGQFNGGLARAANIARTEILDAHRSAAEVSQTGHDDVLEGWIWHAELKKDRGRTCPSCWAKHGTLHPLSEPGPLDHQSGRCSRVPKTKSWAALGFVGLDEPGDEIPTGPQVFAGLPRDEQTAVMGRRRLELLQTGQIDWADLSQLRTTSGWRDSYGVRPIKDLERLAADLDAADRDPSIRDLITDVDSGDRHGAAMQHALTVIDRVHSMPDGMPRIPLIPEHRAGYMGAYQGPRISLNPDGRYPALTAAHELMHFLDHRLGPGGKAFASDAEIADGELFHQWWNAVKASTTARQLRALRQLPNGSDLLHRRRPDGTINIVDVDHKHIDYLLDHREMLGRSYAQWIAVRSGDPVLLADLELAKDPANGERPIPGTGPGVEIGGYPGYWEPGDFGPIAAALNEVFQNLGLLGRRL